VLLVKHDEVVQALAAKRPDHAFCDGVRRWRVNRCDDAVDADPVCPLAKVAAVDCVAIAKQMAWLASPGRRLDDLSPDPGSGRVARHVDVHQLASTVGDEHQHV
jgi:hypothetical protein